MVSDRKSGLRGTPCLSSRHLTAYEPNQLIEDCSSAVLQNSILKLSLTL